MVQELLNRTDDHLWAVLSNGRRLRLLRDSTTITGQSFVEFDLESMFDNDLFPDFVVLYLLCHESRFHVESEGATPVDAWLERWRGVANETGVRVRGELRTGVKAALERLGTGFLRHPANAELRDRLGDGRMTDKELHRELLRLVYRLLFLFVTEDRNLLHATPDADLTEADRVARQRYRDFYSTDKLRRQARTTTRGTRHTDAWQRLWTVLHRLDREGLPELDLPALRGLFAAAPGEFLTVSRPVEVGVDDRPTAWNVLSNEDLLPAIRSLSVTQPKGQGLRRVDFAHLGAEELGSIYESLLELVPRLDLEAREFTLVDLAGNDRKTSGSITRRPLSLTSSSTKPSTRCSTKSNAPRTQRRPCWQRPSATPRVGPGTSWSQPPDGSPIGSRPSVVGCRTATPPLRTIGRPCATS